MSQTKTPGAMVPRCPVCGYTEQDCRERMDNYLSGFPEPAKAEQQPAVGGEPEILGYSVKGNPYAIRLTKGELLELHEGYTGDALVELIDRAHVAPLLAEIERLKTTEADLDYGVLLKRYTEAKARIAELEAAQGEEVATLAKKYDDTLLPFLALMRKELHANADKGDRPGWLSMSADTCMLEIIYHFGKLQASVKRGDADGIAEYGADVANMCMMLWTSAALSIWYRLAPSPPRRICQAEHTAVTPSQSIQCQPL